MIRSVAAQLEPEDRLVIVDAGSTDATRDELERHRAEIAHVEMTPLKQAPAIRWGFDNFDSDICCYLNTDDVLLPGSIARVKAFFEHNPEQDAVYSHRVFIDAAGSVRRIWNLPAHSDMLMGRWDYIPQETCFWRREAMDSAGGIDPSFDFAMDYDFFCRLMRSASMYRMDAYLAAFRDHEESKTSNLVATLGAKEVALVREKYGLGTSGGWRLVGRMLREFVEWRSRSAFTPELQASLQQLVNQSSLDETMHASGSTE